MGYAEEYDLIFDETNALHKKVARALDKAARDVMNEDAGTEHHAVRYVWACGIRQSPSVLQREAHRWIMAVLDNVTVASSGNTASDNDIQFVVNGLVNTMAGV